MNAAAEALERLRPAWARVDLDRLAENFRAVAAAAPVALMPVLKADAYGHGAGVVGRELEALGASLLAVACPEEGVALRRAGVRTPVVVLAGFTAPQLRLLLEHELQAVVSTPSSLRHVLANGEGRIGVHLELDTGMSRLGFDEASFADAGERLSESPQVDLVGVLTHLASADCDPAAHDRQLDRFEQAVEVLARRGVRPRWVHASNSAGLARRRSCENLVRPGLLLYGLSPRPLGPTLPVRPVMTVSAQIALVKDVPAGTPVSYGGRWTASRPTRIATIPLGYADGVPRTERAGAFAVDGLEVPVVGSVCMDVTLADVTDCPAAREGREAVLFGDAPTAWDVADWAGTTAWQVLAGVGPRVPRVYLRGGQVVAVESRYL